MTTESAGRRPTAGARLAAGGRGGVGLVMAVSRGGGGCRVARGLRRPVGRGGGRGGPNEGMGEWENGGMGEPVRSSHSPILPLSHSFASEEAGPATGKGRKAEPGMDSGKAFAFGKNWRAFIDR